MESRLIAFRASSTVMGSANDIFMSNYDIAEFLILDRRL